MPELAHLVQISCIRFFQNVTRRAHERGTYCFTLDLSLASILILDVQLSHHLQFFGCAGMTEACSSMTFLLLHDPKSSLKKEMLVKELSNIPLPKESIGSKTSHLGGVCVGKPAPHVEIRINPQKKEYYNRPMIIAASVMAMKEIESDSSKLASR